MIIIFIIFCIIGLKPRIYGHRLYVESLLVWNTYCKRGKDFVAKYTKWSPIRELYQCRPVCTLRLLIHAICLAHICIKQFSELS